MQWNIQLGVEVIEPTIPNSKRITNVPLSRGRWWDRILETTLGKCLG